MERQKVYVAIELGIFHDIILGIFKQRRDAEDMIKKCGGEYEDDGRYPAAIKRHITEHDLIN